MEGDAPDSIPRTQNPELLLVGPKLRFSRARSHVQCRARSPRTTTGGKPESKKGIHLQRLIATFLPVLPKPTDPLFGEISRKNRHKSSRRKRRSAGGIYISTFKQEVLTMYCGEHLTVSPNYHTAQIAETNPMEITKSRKWIAWIQVGLEGKLASMASPFEIGQTASGGGELNLFPAICSSLEFTPSTSSLHPQRLCTYSKQLFLEPPGKVFIVFICTLYLAWLSAPANFLYSASSMWKHRGEKWPKQSNNFLMALQNYRKDEATNSLLTSSSIITPLCSSTVSNPSEWSSSVTIRGPCKQK